MSKEEIVKKWVKQLVIDFNLCPFAHPVFKKEQIAYELIEGADFSDSLSFVCDKIIELSETDKQKVATTLIILPDFDEDFDEYIDLLYAAENILDRIGLKGRFQLASFHPKYIFEGADYSDVSNYTNRSPFSIIHIIREDDVEMARALYKNIDAIPENNIQTMKKLGEEEVKKILSNILEDI